MHARFVCLACGKEVLSSARAAGRQSYCGHADCQRARKAQWQRQRMAADADYRANQRRCIEEWRRERPGYWSAYRQSRPDKAERNRQLQLERNRRRRRRDEPAGGEGVIAKVDASPANALKLLDDGEYWLVPVIAKMDASRVRITAIPRTCEGLQKRTRSPPPPTAS